MTLFNLVTSLKSLFPNTVTLGVRSLIYELWGNLILSIIWIKLHYLLVYRVLCEYKFSFLWSKYLSLQLLGHIVAACLVF